VLIRKATNADAEKIAYVHVKSWQSTYQGILPQNVLDNLSYEQRAKQCANNMKNENVYVAEDSVEGIVGFSTGGRERTGKYPYYTGELYAIYILEEFQRQGVGKELLKPVLDDLRIEDVSSMLVWVLEHNPAEEFYKTLGGTYLDKMDINMAGKTYQELAYGWERLPQID